MLKLKNAVNELLGEVQEKKGKIQQKIEECKAAEAKAKNDLDALYRELVEYELRNDTKNQEDINRKIAKQNEILNDVQAKINAYSNTFNEPIDIPSRIPELVSLAKEERENRVKAINAKTEQKNQLQEESKNINQQLETIGNELRNLEAVKEVDALRPLLKYIEERPIKHGFEDRYLNAYVYGEPNDREQYIEEPEPEQKSVQNCLRRETLHY